MDPEPRRPERRVSDRRHSSPPTNDTVWRTAAMFLLGLVVTMTTFYVTEFRRAVTREDVIREINALRPGVPWAIDRGSVFERLDRVEREIDSCVPRREFDAYVQRRK